MLVTLRRQKVNCLSFRGSTLVLKPNESCTLRVIKAGQDPPDHKVTAA